MLKIGVVGPAQADSFADNILVCLEDLGVEGVALGAPKPYLSNKYLRAGLDITMRASDSVARRLADLIVKRVFEAECDAVIATQALEPAAVCKLTEAGIPTALWYPDAVANMSRNLS